MADFWRQLPLSARQQEDESAVSRDWRPRIASALDGFAVQLTDLPEERWSEEALPARPGGDSRTVHQVVEELVWRLSSNRLGLIFPSPPRAASRLDLLHQLRVAGARASAGTGRHGLSELTAVVQSCYDVTVPLGLADPVDPTGSGAVALGRAAAAPAELRAILRGRTLAATDAGWRIGTGPAISGTAAVLVSWLSGRPVVPVFEPTQKDAQA